MTRLNPDKYICHTDRWYICAERPFGLTYWTLEWMPQGQGRATKTLRFPNKARALKAAEAMKHALDVR